MWRVWLTHVWSRVTCMSHRNTLWCRRIRTVPLPTSLQPKPSCRRLRSGLVPSSSMNSWLTTIAAASQPVSVSQAHGVGATSGLVWCWRRLIVDVWRCLVWSTSQRHSIESTTVYSYSGSRSASDIILGLLRSVLISITLCVSFVSFLLCKHVRLTCGCNKLMMMKLMMMMMM